MPTSHPRRAMACTTSATTSMQWKEKRKVKEKAKEKQEEEAKVKERKEDTTSTTTTTKEQKEKESQKEKERATTTIIQDTTTATTTTTTTTTKDLERLGLPGPTATIRWTAWRANQKAKHLCGAQTATNRGTQQIDAGGGLANGQHWTTSQHSKQPSHHHSSKSPLTARRWTCPSRTCLETIFLLTMLKDSASLDPILQHHQGHLHHASLLLALLSMTSATSRFRMTSAKWVTSTILSFCLRSPHRGYVIMESWLIQVLVRLLHLCSLRTTSSWRSLTCHPPWSSRQQLHNLCIFMV